MNSNPHNPISSASVRDSGEETLRLIASLPAPTGLEDRIHAALRGTPRRGRVLAWRWALNPERSWMRTAAAAAIVFVVAGGGWGVYTRVQQNQPPRVIVMPPRIPVEGGFSGAGAIRVPQTVPGPVVKQPTKAVPAQPKAPKKPVVNGKKSGTPSAQPTTQATAHPQ